MGIKIAAVASLLVSVIGQVAQPGAPTPEALVPTSLQTLGGGGLVVTAFFVANFIRDMREDNRRMRRRIARLEKHARLEPADESDDSE